MQQRKIVRRERLTGLWAMGIAAMLNCMLPAIAQTTPAPEPTKDPAVPAADAAAPAVDPAVAAADAAAPKPALALNASVPLSSDGKSAIKIPFNRAVEAEDGRVVLTLRSGSSPEVVDLTDLAAPADTNLELDLVVLPLRPGRYSIDVSLEKADGTGASLGVITLEVAAGADAAAAPGAFVFTPKLDIAGKSQLSERVRNGARPSGRPTYRDITLQGSFETAQSGEDWDLKSRVQFSGSSVRSEAVTYGTRAARASKFDLVDYLVDLGYDDSRAQLGQIANTTHPILHSNISNRGFSFAHRFPFGLEITGAAQSSGNLAGTSNLTGLANHNSIFRNFGLGYELMPEKPGQFRVDIAHFDGRQPVQLPSGAASSERSEGYGTRILWRNEPGTFRTEAITAQSDHHAPTPEGGEVTNNGKAYTLESGWDFLKQYTIFGQPLSASISGRREHASPFFRSLGSSFQSNYQLSSEVLNVQWGGMQTQLQGVQRLDNVNSDRRYVRNRVSAQLLNVAFPTEWLIAIYRNFVPLPPAAPAAAAGSSTTAPANAAAAPAASAGPPWWLPALSLSRNVYNQFADEGFIPEGYVAEDLPHVVSTNHAVGLDWKGADYSLSWKFGPSAEKNLQLGAQDSSTRKRRHGITADWRPIKDLSISAGIDRAVGERLDTPINQINAQVRGKVAWKVNTTNDLSFDYSRGRDFDTADTRSAQNRRMQFQWITRFDIPSGIGDKKLPSQAYLRVIDNAAVNASRANNVFVFATPKTQAVQAGFSMTLF